MIKLETLQFGYNLPIYKGALPTSNPSKTFTETSHIYGILTEAAEQQKKYKTSGLLARAHDIANIISNGISQDKLNKIDAGLNLLA